MSNTPTTSYHVLRVLSPYKKVLKYDEEEDRKYCDNHPVVLQDKRDPAVWTKDPQVKEMKRMITSSQHGVNHIVKQYVHFFNRVSMDLNIRLTVGRQQF